MTDDKRLLFKTHECSYGLDDAALQEIADTAETVHCKSGEMLHRVNEPFTFVYVVIYGRLRLSLMDKYGNLAMQRQQGAGGQIGAMAATLGEPSPIDVVAVEPSTLLRWDFRTALDLTARYPVFRQNFARLIAKDVRRVLYQDKYRKRPAIVALFHESPATRPLTSCLLRRLVQLGESPAVLSDQVDWRPEGDLPYRGLHTDGRTLSEEEIRRQVTDWSEARRVLIDVDAAASPAMTSSLVELSDAVLWCVDVEHWEPAVARLRAIKSGRRGWKDKVNVVWLLDRDHQVAPWVPELRELASADLKLSFAAPVAHQGQALAYGVERLIHKLRGICIGVALGGGAARGMAHLGVLKVLEQSGIGVDMIAGTSAGAMTGTLYASGMDPDFTAERFQADLRPSWPFRMLPHGGQWFLLYKYRRRQFDPMLRKYLANNRLEQFSIPVQTITVDLVSGNAIVREQGDAVDAITESINLPVLSTPIYRNGAALVDGGLINNVPADVLVAKGCNFVIAVSVTAKMEERFGRNRADMPTAQMRPVSTVQTVLRSYLVQSKNMNSIGVQPADVVIEPDVTAYDLTEFTRAVDMAAIGEEATREALPKIKEMLVQHDKQLFSSASSEP